MLKLFNVSFHGRWLWHPWSFFLELWIPVRHILSPCVHAISMPYPGTSIWSCYFFVGVVPNSKYSNYINLFSAWFQHFLISTYCPPVFLAPLYEAKASNRSPFVRECAFWSSFAGGRLIRDISCWKSWLNWPLGRKGNCLSKHTPPNSPPNKRIKRTTMSCNKYVHQKSGISKTILGFLQTIGSVMMLPLSSVYRSLWRGVLKYHLAKGWNPGISFALPLSNWPHGGC